MDWETLLITIYVYIQEKYRFHLFIHCQRFSNNYKQKFTDEEVITIYLFGIIKKQFTIKGIYTYAHDHLLGWFPDLPSYVAFVQRLNRLGALFPGLIETILKDIGKKELLQEVYLLDSFPIIMANAKRSSQAKVAKEFANKGYCSSKDMYFYGVKLHILGRKRQETLPLPEYIGLTPGSDHDLNAFRQIAPCLKDVKIFLDKAYSDEEEERYLREQQNVELYKPIKKKKGQKTLSLFDRLFSRAVSRIRQPIESFFNWIQEKTHIQNASKVRSYQGLMVHVFGKFAAAMFLLLMNS